MIKLKGTRICLRDWQLGDLGRYEHWNTGHHAWMDYDGPYYPKLTPEKLQETLEKLRSKLEKGDWKSPRRRMVIAELESDKLIGAVSWYWQSQETNWRSIGIVIYDEANWGKGIGYEALCLWIDYLFEQEPDLVRLDMRTWSGNSGSMGLASKLGFQEEARFRKARVVKGQYYDGIGMGILREEWEARMA